jgi:hypothetical protein
MVLGAPYADHSTTRRRLRSMAMTRASMEKPYMSQSQRTEAPGSSLPLPRLNQNLLVIAGSVNASNTRATGLRMSISALATLPSPLLLSLS